MTQDELDLRTLETLLVNADTRLKEAVAWKNSLSDFELEMSRLQTCLYGANATCTAIRRRIGGRMPPKSKGGR
jgi:hypothetical protein